MMRAIAPFQAVHYEPEWTCAVDDTADAATKHLCFIEFSKKEVRGCTHCISVFLLLHI